MAYNGLVYGKLRGLALNFASTHQTENPRGFSEVVENKQLLIAIVTKSYFFIIFRLSDVLLSNIFTRYTPFVKLLKEIFWI
ncbi:hypothetical protein EVU94_10275 [Flavobacteriaceae bacterium 144Ye]|nr:hypothetical protein EVU94_10275 [Flavobacteriaceae bacterium 144Ye]